MKWWNDVWLSLAESVYSPFICAGNRLLRSGKQFHLNPVGGHIHGDESLLDRVRHDRRSRNIVDGLFPNRAVLLYRFPPRRFAAVVRDPEANPYPQFAGKRVRGTEVFVELVGSHPVRIIRMIYYVLTFNESGVLNKELHMRQEMARYNLHINATIPAENASVLDAKDRFLGCS
jgi:hypothetical protein